MRGPIDYIVVGFNDAKFDGSILKALADALESGVIGLIDLLVVKKDEQGGVSLLNIADLGDDFVVEFAQKYAPEKGEASEDDIQEVGELLEPNEAAGLLVIEQLWAKPLKKAIVDAGGFLVAEGRIHPQAAQELEQ